MKVVKKENKLAGKTSKPELAKKSKAKINNGTVKKKQKDSKSLKVAKSHKKQIEGLKEIDPEFYSFLQENDKNLLEFNLFDSDDDLNEDDADFEKIKAFPEDNDGGDGGDDSDEDDESIKSDNDAEEVIHKPLSNLEVASDESDFEDETVNETQKISLNLLRQWQQQLEQQNVSVDVIRNVIQAFSSALASVSSDSDQRNAPTAFKVVGAAPFNGVVQLCVLYLQPAVRRYLGLTASSGIPFHKTKKWVKVRSCLRYYLTDLIKLIQQVSGSNLLGVLLKHLHQMADVIASFSSLAKVILKHLIVLWSTSEETLRVLAFLSILKITRSQQISMLHHVLKAMYLSYVRNSKFVSPNTLPGINFMRRSLIEMFALDLNVTYQHAFLYIRQLAIHLRNAVILQKKDSFQAVYNWQYINSLRLWVDLLGATANKPQLQPLIYPIVVIAVGVIRLVPTAQYFPLRFHCVHMLISLSKHADIFIPVLPYIFEVLRSNTFNHKHTAVSMRPLQFTCILRLNKAQLNENGFRDEVIEQVCGLSLEYLAHESSSVAFSDLIAPTVIQLKEYLKICRNANYVRKLKQLLDKVQENARLIDSERNKITFEMKDAAQVKAWETQIRNKGTPLALYYNSWMKTHEIKKRRQAAQTDTINADYDLPTINRPKESKKVSAKNESGEVVLFPSDSEDDELPDKLDDDKNSRKLDAKSKRRGDDPPAPKNKAKKGKKSSAKKSTPDMAVEEDNENQHIDIVRDLDLNDW